MFFHLAIRARAASSYHLRTFHTSSPARASILFALHALSNSRETQHFAKLTRLPRTEHSPPLKLIETSEILPYPLPTPPLPAVPTGKAWRSTSTPPALRVWDARALSLGRALLANHARRTHRLQRTLGRAKRRELNADTLIAKERLAWQAERNKARDELRVAGICILLSIGTATALATWRFWPGARESAVDSGELGRRIASRARGAMPLPAIAGGVVEPVVATSSVPLAATAVERVPPQVVPVSSVAPSAAVPGAATLKQSSLWQNLFWKQ
ncbi:hypothetical protein LTR09_008421 [Extremus antarcticus]|uniref:Uncharacterized protein n=1 Tax=Extremus antarcticus TaxID=702011 RepID=A0AAJ0G6V6_9PEZI|nr:hypothetical protein LTR09_008421 [Extremus antarcticus]